MKKPFNEDEDYYYNPEGYIVLTEQYHLAAVIAAETDASIAPTIIKMFRNPGGVSCCSKERTQGKVRNDECTFNQRRTHGPR
jgi:hypothetical protein